VKELLVVVDMQNDFINGALGTAEALKIVPKVCEKIRSFDGNVVCTRDTHGENYAKTQEGRNLPVTHCVKDTDGWQIQDEVYTEACKKGAIIIDKPSFGSVELAETAKLGGYGKITLVGLCTDICVISNAMILKAFLPETEIAVEKELCAGVTPKSHETALEAMKMCQIKIV